MADNRQYAWGGEIAPPGVLCVARKVHSRGGCETGSLAQWLAKKTKRGKPKTTFRASKSTQEREERVPQGSPFRAASGPLDIVGFIGIRGNGRLATMLQRGRCDASIYGEGVGVLSVGMTKEGDVFMSYLLPGDMVRPCPPRREAAIDFMVGNGDCGVLEKRRLVDTDWARRTYREEGPNGDWIRERLRSGGMIDAASLHTLPRGPAPPLGMTALVPTDQPLIPLVYTSGENSGYQKGAPRACMTGSSLQHMMGIRPMAGFPKEPAFFL